jgi:hypothetical protein
LDFSITGTGQEMTLARVWMYLGLLFVLIFLFVLDILAIPMIDSKTKRNDEGELISINNLKYLKVVFVGLAWFFLIAITFIASNLSIAYLETNPLGNLLFVIFRIMMGATYPMILIFFIWILYSLVMDRKMKRMYQRGFE